MNPILISPHIDGETTGEQLRQMKSYLYQFKEQIEMILSNIDTDNLNKNFLDKVNEIEKSSTMKAGNDSSKITQLANEIKLEVERATTAEGVLRSTLSVQADEISAKVEKGVSYSGVTISSGGITCRGRNGSFIIDMDNIKLDASGNVQIKGKIEATSGTIGGWDIGNGILYNTTSWGTSELSESNLKYYGSGSYSLVDNRGAFVYGSNGTTSLQDGYVSADTVICKNIRDAVNSEKGVFWVRKSDAYDTDYVLVGRSPE